MVSSRKAAAASAPYHHGDLRRALVDAALALVTEEQNLGFSLREVARRARVSHNAPYNHFADRSEILAAVAQQGFETLRQALLHAGAAQAAADDVLVALGVAYVAFGVAHPAQYRLMFGQSLGLPTPVPPAVTAAAAEARAVLEQAVGRVLATSPADRAIGSTATGVLSAWALVHGLTCLSIDGLAGGDESEAGVREQVASVLRILLDGLSPT